MEHYIEKKSPYMHVLPFIILVLGGEMIYILDQRLRSQNIAKDRSQKVMQDIVKTMFSKKFMDEVFRPQGMYTYNETKQIFIRLAHSSIMRLNESSMQKLFDLMLMGMKQMTIQSCYPEETTHVVIKHLDTMADMIDKGTDASQLIEDCKSKFVLLVNQFNCYEFQVIKQ